MAGVVTSSESVLRCDKDAARPLRVCFVCTGNTCRSPMAEAVANALAQAFLQALPPLVRESMTPSVEAYSAGLYANEGEPIAQNAVLALERAGVEAMKARDYHRHTAHQLRAEEAESFDLLVGMTGTHAMEMLMRFPSMATRITCLPVEIPDPYGGDESVYANSLEMITQGVRKLLFAEVEKER